MEERKRMRTIRTSVARAAAVPTGPGTLPNHGINGRRTAAVMLLAVALVAFGAPVASALPIGPQPPIVDEPGQVIDPPDDPIASYPMVHDVTATQVTDLEVGLSAGVRTVFETIGLSSGADPVLHLLSPSGGLPLPSTSWHSLLLRSLWVAPRVITR